MPVFFESVSSPSAGKDIYFLKNEQENDNADRKYDFIMFYVRILYFCTVCLTK
jgi:hypothetical protein